MIKEFAIEPTLLSDWKDCRYLIEKFGFHKGRVISKFPKNWIQLVIQASDRHSKGERNRKYIVEKLKKFKSAMVSSWRDYQDPENWLKSAEIADEKRPFHAILAERNPNDHCRVIAYENLSEEHALFNCPTECSMKKNKDGFSEIAGPLLRYSKQIIFVDHYFWNVNYNFKRWGEPLKAMLRNISSNEIMPRFCTSASLDGEALQDRQEKIERNLPSFVPCGLKLEIALLDKVTGLDTHNRYILTERGGLKFPWGLDAKPDGSSDVVNLMAPEVHEAKFNEFYEPGSHGHPVVKRFVIVGTAAERDYSRKRI